MRMAGTSRVLVSSQSFRGEIARKRAASAGRSRSGSGVERRPTAGCWVLSILGGRGLPRSGPRRTVP